MSLPDGRRGLRRDAPTTVGLLLIGLYTTVRSVDVFRMLPDSLADDYRRGGLGTFHGQALAAPIGVAMCVVQIVSLVIAIGFSVPRIRDARVSWWVPLLCAGVCWLLTFVLFAIAALGDPADLARLSQMSSS